MAKLTEPMIIARTKCSDINSIKSLNCWGNDLTDVSLVQRMPNVEVLALSVNNISTLADFQQCRKLRELYLRKNTIRSLNEVCYLQQLPNLRNLTLSENPCTNSDSYRLSVIKALPDLQTLDDQSITDDERRTAARQGLALVHPEDEEGETECWSPATDAYHSQRISNGLPAEATPEQCWDVDLEESEPQQQQQHSAPVSAGQSFESSKASPGHTPPEMHSPEPARYYQEEYADRRNANYENTHPSPPSEHLGYLRQSAAPAYQSSGHAYQPSSPAYYNAQSPTSPEAHAAPVQRRRVNSRSPDLPPHTPPSPSTPPFMQATPTNGCSPSEHERGPRCRADGEARLCPELPLFPCSHQEEDYYRASQHVQQPRHRFSPAPHPPVAPLPTTRRKSRTSNILSAVLCLLKELDYQSLEVVDTTVNARMNELMHEHSS